MSGEEPSEAFDGDLAARAESVFTEWLAELEDGESTPNEGFEALCVAHPTLEAELRRIHAGWERLAPLFGMGEGQQDESDGSRGSGAGRRALQDVVRALEDRGSFGRYEMDREIGRGGMGVVHRVWDPDLKRELAMKQATLSLHEDAKSSSGVRRQQAYGRFLEEAQITGQLDHPGIVPVHELGIDDGGRLYFTMRLVRGSDLSKIFELVKTGQEDWTPTRALNALLKACEALAYAHAKGVVHRDLKPANIMVGPFGEVYVMDWGLARVLNEPERRDVRVAGIAPVAIRSSLKQSPESTLATMDGDIVGTAAYMSPEQARGELDAIGPHSDVYSMGAILYELLAGHAPYGDEELTSPYAVWRRACTHAPLALSAAAPHQPDELVAICEKAMSRGITDRYTDVRELGADLRAYLENRVVRAHRTGAWVEFRKWVGRNRGTALAVAASVLLAFVGLASTSYVQAQGQAEQKRLNKQLRQSNTDLAEARDEAERNAQSALEQKDRADEEAARAAEQARIAVLNRDAAEGVVNYIVELFEAADPNNTFGEPVTAKHLLDRGVQRLDTVAESTPEFRANMLDAMVRAYNATGDYASAEPLAEEAIRLRELNPTLQPEAVWWARHNLAATWIELGRAKEAVPMLEEVVEQLEAILGPTELRCFQVRYTLCRARATVGDTAIAEEKLRELIEEAERVRGSEDLTVLDMWAELARLAYGRPLEAEAILRKILETQVSILHADDTRILRTRNTLGRTLWQQQRFEEAEPLFRSLVEATERVLGPEHPHTLTAYNNLSSLLRVTGEAVEAERFVRIAYDRALIKPGADHPQTWGILENLATAIGRQGRWDEAEKLHLEALEGLRETLGASHPTSLVPLRMLANDKIAQGEFDEAESLAREHQELAPNGPFFDAGRRLLERIESARAAAESP